MAKITIPDEPTIATFTVTTSNDTFPIDFAIFAKADLRVMVGMTELEQGDFLFDGALLEGGGYQGGTVTLNTPVASTTVRIWRDLLPQRSENFGAVTSVPVAAVDLALSRQMAVSQDIKRDQEVVLEALPYLADLPNTVDSVFDARDEALAATANKVDLDAANLSAPQKITFLDAIGAPLASEVATSLAGKINYAELSGGAAPAGGDARLRIKTNVEFFRTGDILDQFETEPGISNARALQAGINALAAIGGGTIETAPGDFLLSNPNASTTDNERFAIEGKPWVRVDFSSSTVIPDETVSTVAIFGTAVSSCDGFSIVNGYFDCNGMGTAAPVKPSGAYQYFGGCGIAQRNGPVSKGLWFDALHFDFPDIDPSDAFVPYHACVMADGEGIWSNCQTPRCGGDCYQFNGGYWGILNPQVGECSDGAVAINNGFQGIILGGILRKSNLGVGGGPYGLEGDTKRDIYIGGGLLIIEPNIAVNLGWYSLWNRVGGVVGTDPTLIGATRPEACLSSTERNSGNYSIVDGVATRVSGTVGSGDPRPIGEDALDSCLSDTKKTNGDYVRKSPPKGVVIDGVKIERPKSGGVWFISGAGADYGLTVRNIEITGCGSNDYGQGQPDNDASSTIAPIAIVGAGRSYIQAVVRDTIVPSGHPGVPAFVISGCDDTLVDIVSIGNAKDAKFEASRLFISRMSCVKTISGVISYDPVIEDAGYSLIGTYERMIGGNPNWITRKTGSTADGYYCDLATGAHHWYHADGNNGFTSFPGGYTKRGLEAPRRSFGTEASAQGGFTDPSTGGVSYEHGLSSGKSRIIWCKITIDTGVGGPVVQLDAQWDDTNLGFPSSAYLNKAYTVQGEYSSVPVR